MRINHQVVVFDAADLAAESSFWAGVLNGTVDAEDDWHMVIVDGEPRSVFSWRPTTSRPTGPMGHRSTRRAAVVYAAYATRPRKFDRGPDNGPAGKLRSLLPLGAGQIPRLSFPVLLSTRQGGWGSVSMEGRPWGATGWRSLSRSASPVGMP